MTEEEELMKTRLNQIINDYLFKGEGTFSARRRTRKSPSTRKRRMEIERRGTFNSVYCQRKPFYVVERGKKTTADRTESNAFP